MAQLSNPFTRKTSSLQPLNPSQAIAFSAESILLFMGIESRIFLTFATLRATVISLSLQDLNGNTHCVSSHILASKLLFNCVRVGGAVMADEKDRFGETTKLVERARRIPTLLNGTAN